MFACFLKPQFLNGLSVSLCEVLSLNFLISTPRRIFLRNVATHQYNIFFFFKKKATSMSGPLFSNGGLDVKHSLKVRK